MSDKLHKHWSNDIFIVINMNSRCNLYIFRVSDVQLYICLDALYMLAGYQTDQVLTFFQPSSCLSQLEGVCLILLRSVPTMSGNRFISTFLKIKNTKISLL